MSHIPLHHANLSIQQMFDLICFNLAQYNHIYQADFAPFERISTLSEYIDFYTTHLQGQAREISQHMSALTRMMNESPTMSQKKMFETRLQEFQSILPYNPLRVTENKGYAKQLVKESIPLRSFKVTYIPQHKAANSWDSFGRFNLFGTSNISSQEMRNKFTPYFAMPKSFGPIFDNVQVGEKVSQESIGLFLSRQTPPKAVQHQIWVNDEIVIQANFKTKQSLDSYLDDHPHLMEEIFFNVAYAQAIQKRIKNDHSQSAIETEMDKERLEFVKKENEKFMEQYLLLTIELYCRLVYKMKEKYFLNTTKNIFTNINSIPTIKNDFSDEDIEKMKKYLEIRNSIAHPTLYNLRPLELEDMKNFVPTMVKYLGNLLHMDEKNIRKKIAEHKTKDIGSVRFLILMTDAAKALRKICIEHGNLPYNTEDPFVQLGFITKEEDEIIKQGIILRNDLCHYKIDQAMAKKAQELKESMANSIVSIANAIEEKFNLTLQDYFFDTPKNKSTPIENLNRSYPGVLIHYDEDKEIIQSAFVQNKKQAKPDKELLLNLYCIACTVNAIMFENEPLYNNPYYEKEDLLPFIREVNTEFRKNSNRESSNRTRIFKIVANKFRQDKNVPKPKNSNQRG